MAVWAMILVMVVMTNVKRLQVSVAGRGHASGTSLFLFAQVLALKILHPSQVGSARSSRQAGMLTAVGTVGLSWSLRWSLRDHGMGREVKRQVMLDLWVMEKC